MNQQSLALILNTFQEVEGSIIIYTEEEMDPEFAYARLPRLASLVKYDLPRRHGIELTYCIPKIDDFSQETIEFRLLAPYSCSPMSCFELGDGKNTTHELPKVTPELGRYSYSYDQTLQVGQAILRGELEGPLEHEVLRECLEKDKQPIKMQRCVGEHMVALGEFAQHLKHLLYSRTDL